MLFEEVEARFLSGEIFADCRDGTQEFYVRFIKPSEYFINTVPGFMGVSVLVSEPDFLFILVDVAATHMSVDPSAGFFCASKECFAQTQGDSGIRVVEANENVSSRFYEF